MHVLGKVFAFGLIPILAIAAIMLTTMTLDVRTRWQKQVDEARAAYDAIAADLEVQRNVHRQAQDALDRVKEPWGNVWIAPNSRPVNPAAGTISIGAGTAQGLGEAAVSRPANPTIYVFNVNGDESEYLGEFRIQSAQAGSTDAVAVHPPAPGQNFPAGTWCIRDSIPASYSTRYMDLYTEEIRDVARLDRTRTTLQRIQNELTNSQYLLEQRMKQLLGDPDLENATQLQKDGYVKAIRDGLTLRDERIARYHALQVERRLKFESLVLIEQENRQRLQQYRASIGLPPEEGPPYIEGRLEPTAAP